MPTFQQGLDPKLTLNTGRSGVGGWTYGDSHYTNVPNAICARFLKLGESLLHQRGSWIVVEYTKPNGLDFNLNPRFSPRVQLRHLETGHIELDYSRGATGKLINRLKELVAVDYQREREDECIRVVATNGRTAAITLRSLIKPLGDIVWELQGTERQVLWAWDIRRSFLMIYADLLLDGEPTRKPLLEAVDARQSARWWIDVGRTTEGYDAILADVDTYMKAQAALAELTARAGVDLAAPLILPDTAEPDREPTDFWNTACPF